MPRYIDADAFVEDIKTEAMNLYLDGMKGTPRPYRELYDIIDRINEQPAADVVEVVMCKDCMHWRAMDDGSWHNQGRLDGQCKMLWDVHYAERCLTGAEHFCSYGERKK